MTEQEGKRKRKDRAGWEGVGGVGEGVVGKRGGLRNWKKEDRSRCSLGLGHLFALKGFNHSRIMEGIVNPDWQNCNVVVAQLTMQEACY